jgi:hypothetical protein
MTSAGIRALMEQERKSMSEAAQNALNRIELKPKQAIFSSGRKRDKTLYNGWIIAGDPEADRYIAFSESPWVDTPEWFILDGVNLSASNLNGCPSAPSLKSLLEDTLALNALPHFKQFIEDICAAPPVSNERT